MESETDSQIDSQTDIEATSQTFKYKYIHTFHAIRLSGPSPWRAEQASSGRPDNRGHTFSFKCTRVAIRPRPCRQRG
ncbi:unnamed protein product [Protopolystoma xenopodis]|uniref:Uncharacterized protein n=1 Tax=Protopolystoma xenopodis TaxID=117903 RepID=A0A448XRL9_9PLAT|nr:unnamed protein product [Protopolystoma xenopodis]